MAAERAHAGRPGTGGVDDIGTSILALIAHNEEKYQEPIGKARLHRAFFLLSRELPRLGPRLDYRPRNSGPRSGALERALDRLKGSNMVGEGIEDGCKNLHSTERGRGMLAGVFGKIGGDVAVLLPQINDFLYGMSRDEMLAYVGLKYPETAANSGRYHNFIKPQAFDFVLALKEKGKITSQRGAELLGIRYTEMRKRMRESGE